MLRHERGLLLLVVLVSVGAQAADPPSYGLGIPISIDVLERLNTTVPPDGAGLPDGQGTFEAGRAIYASKCLACHGDALQGTAAGPALIGGRGSLNSDTPTKTVESFWPYATSVFSYIRNTMPTTEPGSLTDNECYSLMSFILASADIVPTDEVMNRESLVEVQMPNRNGFVPDPRPDIPLESGVID